MRRRYPHVVARGAAAPAPRDACRVTPAPCDVVFSVVVPTYNRAGILPEAIASVLAQTERRFEVLIVDDGSVDDTESRVRELHDPRVSYVRMAHAGVSAARNTGIALATGRYVSFLDSDDLWKSDKLATETAFFERHPEVGIVFADLEKWDGATYVPSFTRTTEIFSKWLTPAPGGTMVLSPRAMRWCLLQEVPVKVPSLTVRRDLLTAAGGFDPTWSSSEDWELLLRLASSAPFGYIDRPLAVIRVSPDSLHRLDQERGESAMIELLARERANAADGSTRAAARRGLAVRTKHLAWHYAGAGRRLAGSAAYVRGFVKTGDPGLLVRAVVVLARARRACR